MSLKSTQASPRLRGFGQRLRELRLSLGYTQAELAYALGINAARYHKYEIGRSEAPYGVLVRLAKLVDIDLHELITGQPCRKYSTERTFPAQLTEVIDRLPVPAVVYDQTTRLIAHNRLYLEALFRGCPSIIRPGMSHEFVLRAWANSRGLDAHEADQFVQARLQFDPAQTPSHQLRAGNTRLQIAETRQRDYKLILVTDITELQ